MFISNAVDPWPWSSTWGFCCLGSHAQISSHRTVYRLVHTHLGGAGRLVCRRGEWLILAWGAPGSTLWWPPHAASGMFSRAPPSWHDAYGFLMSSCTPFHACLHSCLPSAITSCPGAQACTPPIWPAYLQNLSCLPFPVSIVISPVPATILSDIV